MESIDKVNCCIFVELLFAFCILKMVCLQPLRSSDMREIVPSWYAAFVSIEQEEIFEIILAANFLDIRPLLDLTCASIASIIRGKNTDEIRQAFHIVNDFTPEEEDLIREENKWIEDM